MVGSGILLVFGLSSAIGGPLASVFMSLVGSAGLFAFCAVSLLLFSIGIFFRRKAHVIPVHDETEPFRVMSDSITPMAMEMDPRTEEGHLEEFQPDQVK